MFLRLKQSMRKRESKRRASGLPMPGAVVRERQVSRGLISVFANDAAQQ